jgi:hypothetical protein
MSPEKILAQWHRGIRICHIKHKMAATHFSRLNRIYGIPVVVLSTVVGTTAFSTVKAAVDPPIQILVGLLSVAAAVLASLQTFLSFSELAERTRATAARYGKLRRDVEHVQAFLSHHADDLPNLMKTFKERWDHLSQEAPEVPERIHNRAVHIVNSERVRPSADNSFQTPTEPIIKASLSLK